MTTAAGHLTQGRSLTGQVVRYSIGVVGVALLVVATIDVSTAWRTRGAAGHALTELATGRTTASGGAPTDRCTVVGAGAIGGPDLAAICRAKAATGLDDLDVRLRVHAEGAVTVACAMTHLRSTTGLLGALVDRVTTARRIVAVDGTGHDAIGLDAFGEAPFPGESWAFCSG
jgi:hypothetical protein